VKTNPLIAPAMELRRQGLTLEKIGAAIGGRSRECVRQLVLKGTRIESAVQKAEETGIKSFDLISVRSANGLIFCNVLDVHHLQRLGPRFVKTMLREPNFGKKSYREILEFMGWTEENVEEDCRRPPWHRHIHTEELIECEVRAANP